MAGNKFSAEFYVTAYELARDGLSEHRIAAAIGVTQPTFRKWCRRRPALANAVERGRAVRGGGNKPLFHQYVYDHLPQHLRNLWDEINACDELENGVERVEALLVDQGIRARQHLFLYALTQSMFNVSQSLKKLNISYSTFKEWVRRDPLFAELMDEIHWYKENFFEQAFIGRVAAGDTQAIIHAVKTKCRDRGYNEKIEIEHTGTVEQRHTVSILDLDLDVGTRRKVLEAMRAKRVIDAEPVHNSPTTPKLITTGNNGGNGRVK